MFDSQKVIAGRYAVIKSLGQGGFGEVYAARDLLLARRVIVKVAHGAPDDSAARSLQREAGLLGTLAHPAIARFIDSGVTDEGLPFLVSEYVEGVNLADLLSGEGALPQRDALGVFRSLADALSYAHSRGIIHRDIKPSNVIIPEGPEGRRYDRAMLIDFGAFGRLERKTGQTQPGMIVGTVTHMSPEQALGQAQSPASDVYGLGLLLYEMIYGLVPFTGESVYEIFSQIVKGEVILPAEPELSPPLRALILRCLSREPGDRPRSGAELMRELDGIFRPDVTPRSRADAGFWPDVTPPPPAEAGIRPEMMPPTASRGGARALRKFRRALRRVTVLLLAAALAGLLLWGVPRLTYPAAGMLLGIFLAVGGTALAFAVRRWLRGRRSRIERDASDILFGSASRESLTATLALQVDEVVARVHKLDERILANTLVIMLREYETAKESQDRQAALMNAIHLLEKLATRLSPWYVHHEKSIALAVALVGIASGVASVAASAMQMWSNAK